MDLLTIRNHGIASKNVILTMRNYGAVSNMWIFFKKKKKFQQR